MPPLGAHMSIAGGYYKAIERAVEAGCDCVQIFTTPPRQWPVQAANTDVQSGRLLTKNNNQWRAKELTNEDVELFRETLGKHSSIQHTLSHASYLINLASPDGELWQKSVDAMEIELLRAERLGVPSVVVHPGAYITTGEEGSEKSGKEKTGKKNRKKAGDKCETLEEAAEKLATDCPEVAGLARIVDALLLLEQRTAGIETAILLENTAGQGTNLGWCFEQLGWVLQRVDDSVGVCIDSCHAFAAGYSLTERRDYLATMRALDAAVGLERVQAFHLNDSKKERGSRVDRHDNIGLGEMGLEPFRHLVNDRRFRRTPMYLETPKGDHNGRPWDAVNLLALRELKPAKRRKS